MVVAAGQYLLDSDAAVTPQRRVPETSAGHLLKLLAAMPVTTR